MPASVMPPKGNIYTGEAGYGRRVQKFVRTNVYREIVQRAEFTSVAAVAGKAAERLAAAPTAGWVVPISCLSRLSENCA